jgi:KDO2-lipid IV(A) lauroyltransferase
VSYKNYIQAGLALSLIWVLKALGLRFGAKLAGAALLALGRRTREHKLAEANMSAALPDMTPQQRKTALRNMWRNIGHVLAEMAYMKRIAAQADQRLHVHGREHLHALKVSGKPFILVSAHTGNWEINMVLLEQMGFEAGAIYRRSNNPIMDKWIVDQRAGYMPHQIPKGAEGSKQMIRLLKDGVTLGALIDQRLNTGDPISFFGRPTRAPSAAVKLAHRFDLMVLPVRVCRRANMPDTAYFDVHVEAPFNVKQSDDRQADTDRAMAHIYARFEAWISDRPAEWFWVHDRWRD